MADQPLVTVAVPSFNQGHFLDEALASIFSQDIPVESI
jgi:glycosyltransferase involved in cell wall biosynthesis